MKKPLISVIIPIYNVAPYLAQCLDSVIGQTLQDIEIICINDGSTDNSPTILEEYQYRDSRIKVIHKPNTGYGHSMNMGLSEAQGEYLSIIESDDIAQSQMLETLYNTACRHGFTDIVKGKFLYYWSQKKTTKKMNDSFFHHYDIIFNPLDEISVFLAPPCIWSGIYKRSFIQQHNISFNETEGASYQDVAFNFKSMACAKTMVLVDYISILYRQDNAGSSVKQRDKVYSIIKEYENIDQFILNQPKEVQSDLKRARNAGIFYAYRWNFERIHPKYKKEFAEFMYQEFSEITKNKGFERSLFPEKDWLYIQRILKGSQSFMHHIKRKKFLQALDPIRFIKNFYNI